MKISSSKNVWARLGGGLGVMLLAAGVFGSSSATAAPLTIKDSKHNLGSSSTGPNKFGGTGEICVFCHTPHGSDTADKIPLWNRTASAGTTYQTYSSLGTLSLDGGTLAVGSTSLACLSCHDGTQAMNVGLKNAPGSGTSGNTAWSTGTWTVGTGKPTGIALIDTDLRNDHPVGIQYAGGPKTGTTIDATYGADKTAFNDADFKPINAATLNGQLVWWVETNDDATRQKTDLPLYARKGDLKYAETSKNNTITTDQPFVECASCHDPHNANANTFLRIDNSESKVCLACHDK